MVTQHTFEAGGPAGPHTIAYMEWGQPDNPDTLLCVHGLTRNSRDFDDIARELSEHYRVICMDVAGRGDSAWLENAEHYGYEQYVADALTLIAHLGCERVDWLGTSMGGILGMLIGAMSPSPIGRLVVNDVGPVVPAEALQRIARYLAARTPASSFDAFETTLRVIHAPFGPLSDEQWRHLAQFSSRQLDDGNWDFKYDPGIAKPFSGALDEDLDLWSVWDAIACPVLLLRGEASDVLPREIAIQAQSRGPKTDFVEFRGIGHAPALMAEDQMNVVKKWLTN